MKRRLGILFTIMALVVPTIVLSGVRATWSAYSSTTGNANTFAAVANLCTSYTTAWMTGFESGVVSTAGGAPFAGSNISGSTTIATDSTVSRSGNYSLKITKVGGSNGQLTSPSLGSSTSIAMRVAIRFPSLPGGGAELFRVTAASGNAIGLRYNSATTKFMLNINGSSQDLAGVIAVDTWYRIDLKYDVSTTTRTATARVNGGAASSVSTADVVSTVASVRPGTVTAAEAFTAYYDDILVTTSAADYPLPDGRIKALSPNSYIGKTDHASNYLKETNGTTNLSSTSYSLLDEVPLTSTADYLQQTTGSATDYFAEFGLDDVTQGGCVNAASAFVAYHSAGTTANSLKTAVWDNTATAAEHIVTDNGNSVATAALQYRQTVITPNSGVWDGSKLTNATVKLGYFRAGGSVPYWDGVLLEYDQVPTADTAYPAVVSADSPIDYWRLGDTSGTTATATTGTNGTYANAPTLGVDNAVGDSNTSIYLDGTNDRATLAYGAALNPANFTVEAWVKPTVVPGNFGTAVGSAYDSGATNRGYWLGLKSTGNWVLQVGTGTAFTNVTGTAATLNSWTHLVGTYDGNTACLYVNGTLAASAATAYSANTSAAFGIGAWYSNDLAAWTDYLTGGTDEVALYNTALSQARVTAHYNAGLP